MIVKEKTQGSESLRRKNIPIFIPHLGCPNMCVFCNQRSISGQSDFVRENVAPYIENAIDTLPDYSDAEIAFFGGSFTGIDRELMIYLLELAETYIGREYPRGIRISGIRMSTRPDYVSDEILDILANYSVSAIELGLQSMDDRVLSATQRGHSSADAERACRLIRERGRYQLVGQMMIGLPESTPESEVETARSLCRLGVDAVRIYPTVVFYGTELCHMAERGEYAPLDCEDAVERSKRVLAIFMQNGIKCLRIGLCASENLVSDEAVYGGANHPALGELVISRLWRDAMQEALEKSGVDSKKITFLVDASQISKATGQHRNNINYIKDKFGLESVSVKSVAQDKDDTHTITLNLKI